MKSMEDMIKAAQEAAQTIQKQMDEAQITLDKIEDAWIDAGFPAGPAFDALLDRVSPANTPETSAQS